MVLERKIRKQQVLYYQGEVAQGVDEIVDGVVRAYTTLSNGSEVNIAVYGPGDYFPIETAYDIAPATIFCYEALSGCRVLHTTKEEFIAKRAANPAATICMDSKRYVGALLHINAVCQATASQKLGQTLRYLTLRFGDPLLNKNYLRIALKLTQQDLANLSSLSRETVNIELTKLKDKKAVTERAKTYSVNLKILNDILGDELEALAINL